MIEGAAESGVGGDGREAVEDVAWLLSMILGMEMGGEGTRLAVDVPDVEPDVTVGIGIEREIKGGEAVEGRLGLCLGVAREWDKLGLVTIVVAGGGTERADIVEEEEIDRAWARPVWLAAFGDRGRGETAGRSSEAKLSA